jgi:hypothetical protein
MTDHAKMDKIEELCLAEYEAHKYKIILATLVNGWNDHDHSVEVFCDPPARLRVQETRKNDIQHWNDDWCDPYWDVELVEPHPALENIRSLWVFGISHSLTGEIQGTTTQHLDPNQEPAYEPPQPKKECTDDHQPNTKTVIFFNCPCCDTGLTITIEAHTDKPKESR